MGVKASALRALSVAFACPRPVSRLIEESTGGQLGRQ